jgi:hypothetical protein
MSVIDVLKEIILDFQTQTLETGVPRRLRIEPVPGKAVCPDRCELSLPEPFTM